MNSMKNTSKSTDDDMRSEYDFSKGVRGKHYRSLREGHTVTVHQEDGTIKAGRRKTDNDQGPGDQPGSVNS